MSEIKKASSAQPVMTLTDERIDAIWDALDVKDLDLHAENFHEQLRYRFARDVLEAAQGEKK